MATSKYFLFLACAGLFAVTLNAASPRPIVLTTDCGADMDDQWALAHLAVSPEFELRAVITTHTGAHPILPPPAAESSARIAREVLAAIPALTNPPVIPGSSVPLTSRSPLRNPGVDRIVAESQNFSPQNRLTVLVIGAATDTASALLLDPTLADRIQIVAMGFKNWNDADEFNIVNDPIAWGVILGSATPVTVGDAAVTKRDLAMTSARAHALLDPAGAPGSYLAGLLDQWFSKHPGIVRGVTGDPEVWPVWDEVTVAYLLGFAQTEQRPRPKFLADLTLDHTCATGSITWVTSIDSVRLWENLAEKLTSANTSK